MTKSLAVVLLLLAFAAPNLQAQEQPSKVELYGGYDYVRFNINANVSGQPPFQVFNGNGGGGELTVNVSRWMGVLGDLGGYWATNATKQGAVFPTSLARGSTSATERSRPSLKFFSAAW